MSRGFHVRESTIIRDKSVCEMYRRKISELGCLAAVVSKSYIYGLIRKETGLNERTIADIINHSENSRKRDAG